MDYSRLSDEDLINLFLQTGGDRAAIRDHLFSRYYERFDQRIRGVLYTCNLPYSPSESYYNEIFIEVYQQVFHLEHLEDILRKYKPESGKFSVWFINYVVVNRVKDWLKRVDKSSGLKNIERLSDGVGRERNRLALDEPIDRNSHGNGLTFTDILPAAALTPDEETQGAIASAVAQMSPALRIMFQLLFVAYDRLSDEDLNYLAEEIKKPVKDTQRLLEQLGREIQASDEYQNAGQAELSLAALTRQEEYLHHKLDSLETELNALFPEEPIPQTGPDTQLKELALLQEELEGQRRHGRISNREYHRQFLILQHRHTARQLSQTARKTNKLAQEYRSGKFFITPTYKQLAGLLGITEGGVAARINRLTVRLRELLQPRKENPPEIRISKAGRNKAYHKDGDRDYAK